MGQTETKKLYNIGVISLGCDKNRVDTEKMLFRIKSYGHNLVNDLMQADVIIVNTCAFLQSSRAESIDTIIDVYNKSGGKPVIVTGCLPQKFIGSLYGRLTEAAGFLGTGDYDRITEAIDAAIQGRRFNGVGTAAKGFDGAGRVITTPKHYAFLMIADGCDNCCSYCLIPSIRGRYRSFKIESIINEARLLVSGGVKELILVAQDVTRYGKDIYGEFSLVKLIRELSKIEGLPDGGIRLLYCYPELVSEELIDEIKNNAKVIKYIDIPMQHISDNILSAMKRRSGRKSIVSLIEKLRKEIPMVSIRSTFIVGFPGETERDFEELCDFLRKYRLDNAGFFAYSREKGTASYSYKNQVHYRTKQRRLKTANLLQQGIYYAANKGYINKIVNVMCDGYDGDSKMYYGRTASNAPLSDKLVYFTSCRQLSGGDNCKVLIESCNVYDMYGKLV